MSFFRRSSVLLAAAIAFWTAAPTPAVASQVVFGNLGSDGSDALDSGNQPVSISTWFAQGFSTGAGSTNLLLDTVTLGLRQTTAGAGINTTVSLRSVSGGNPGTVLATSASASVSSIDPTKYAFNFGGFQLTAGTSYFVVLSQSGVSWNYAASFETPAEQNSSGYDFFATRRTTNGGTSWSNFGNTTLAISLAASSTAPAAVPEPGTWAAAVLLFGAAAYVRWRRRPQAA